MLAGGCSDNPTPSDDGPDTKAGDPDTGNDVGVTADAKTAEDSGGSTDEKDTGSGDKCSSDDDCDAAKLGVKANECEAAVCNASGQCEVGNAKDGAKCDDGWECTGDEKCSGGKCKVGTAGTGEACTDKHPSWDKNKAKECVTPACNPVGDGTCDWNNIPPSAAKECDDGNACTTEDKCSLGQCLGKLKSNEDCNDDNDCTKDECSPTDGCVNVAAADDTICNDGNKCTADTKCTKGVCAGGKAVTCDDKDPCTDDSCDKDAGCKFKVQPDGVTCNDGSACTEKDACKKGVCTGQLIASAVPPSPCVDGKCNPLTGKTEFKQVADGKVCDDDDPCSNGDTCQGGSCKGTVLKCEDGNPCTKDACDDKTGTCKSVPMANGVTCTDNNKCTSLDNCVDGVCKGDDYTKTGACDDKNQCTSDGCQPLTGCFHTPASKICSDDNPCTVNDKCTAGKCGGIPKDCNDGDPCTNDSCNKDANGKCDSKAFIGPCDDNNKCTQSDTCDDKGKCSGKDIDCNDDNPCTIDVCASDKGCTAINEKGGTDCKDGATCVEQAVCSGGKCLVVKHSCKACEQEADCSNLNDGNACTGTFKCEASAAMGKKVCNVPKSTIPDCTKIGDGLCSIGVCNKANGACEKQLKPNGAPCNDGDKCTEKTFCDKNGSCLGTKIDCNDKEDCTLDSCDAKIGCLHAKKKDGEICTDNNKCTGGDACSSGVCTAKVNTCPCNIAADCAKHDDGDLCNGIFDCVGNQCIAKKDSEVKCPESKIACVENFCQKATGKCQPIKQQDGTPCDDNDKCTLKDTCSSGKCDGDDAVKAGLCDDKNVCTTDVCDPFFGCTNAKKGIGQACDDGNKCTQNTKCDKNDICAGQKIDCDDGNSCTLDTCKAGTGCFNQIDNTLKCDDNNPCTTEDKCDQGICTAKDVDCDDKNPCTVDVCAGKSGCKNVIQSGKDCDDGQPCTIGDTCDLAGKCGGKDKNCNDGTDCTEDSCVNGACVSKAKVGLPCNDNDQCTDNDLCDKEGVCKSTKLDCEKALNGNVCRKVVGPCSPVNGCTYADNDGFNKCTDNNQCTINDTCSGGTCQGKAFPCDDNNPCTIDSCKPEEGCKFVINTCDDGNDCTFDKCDPPASVSKGGTGKGCLNSAIDGFQPCNDDNPCTHQGKCSGSKCELKALPCNDENVCTLDSCNSKYELKKDDKPEAACVFAPVESTATVCDDGNKCTSDHCDGKGKCIGEAVKCDDGNDCTKDSCDKDKGCIKTDEANGLKCDDGDVCTKDTKCHGGLCSGGTKTCFQCQAQKDCDAFDNSTRCDGWLECVIPQGSKFGTCIPRNDPSKGQDPIACDTTNDGQCLRNLCQPKTGKCEMTQSLNGSACEDGDPCTINDSCTNGKCKTGVPADCSSVANACNTAECRSSAESKTGYECVAVPRLPFPATPLCDADGDGCTANDFCVEGKCTAGPKVDCSGTAQECEVATCKSTGSKSFTCNKAPAKDGAECDDKQFCTAGDSCKAGKCIGGLKAPDCTSFDGPCSTGFCDAKANGGFGACQPKIKPDSDKKPCNSDDNGCTVNDICVNGICVAGAPPNCSDLNSTCTVGACKSTGALQYECIAAPTNDSKPCEADKDGCTVGDHCSKGKCVAGNKPDCSDKGDGKCLVGACKSLGNAHYTCVGEPAKAGSPCDADSNGCTRNDACNDKGACQPGLAVNCNKDAGTCSTGSCVSTGKETFECQGQNKQDGTACDADADGCTVGDKCQGGKCIAGKGPDCSKFDKGQCVVGGCTNKGSDQYICEAYPKKNGDTCDADKDGCTKNDACEGGSCVKGELETCKAVAGVCVDESCKSEGSNAFKCLVVPKESYKPLDPPAACTPTSGKAQDNCDKGYICNQTGTVQDPKFGAVKVGSCAPSVTISCDDDSQCTASDACHGGSCVGGASKVCDDDDPCTLDSCNAKDGTCEAKKIAGCTKCIDANFEPGTGAGDQGFKDWSVSAAHEAFLTWKTDKAAAVGNSEAGAIASWKGKYSYKDITGQTVTPDETVPARLLHRRYYIRKGAVSPILQFRMVAKFADQGCERDVFQVLVNNKVMYQQCKDTDPTKFTKENTTEKISISMAEWAGDAVDIEFRVWADAAAPNGFGEVKLDNVVLAGDCGTGCASYGFEPIGLDRPFDPANFQGGVDEHGQPLQPPAPTPPSIPQPLKLKADAANYFAWKLVDKDAYTGKGAIQATYKGAPPGAKAQTAAVLVPMVRPVSKDVLYFAMKMADLGGTGNQLEIKAHVWDNTMTKYASTQSVFKSTSAQQTWSVQKLDLSALAGKTLDLEFVASTASSGGDAKGTFMLDAIAIQGLCTYACFNVNFDVDGIKSWQISTGDKEKKAKVATDKSTSSPNSLYLWYDTGKATEGKPLMLIGDILKGVQMQGSVLGMTYEYNVNLFQSTGICPPPGDNPLPGTVSSTLSLRGLYTDYPEFIEATSPGFAANLPRYFDIHENCESTKGGWERKTGTVPEAANGRLMQAQFWFSSPKKVKETKGYVDDVSIMCK